MHVKGIKERILDSLKKGEEIPIYRVAEGAEISVATASKYFYVLAAENKIHITSFGNMKLVKKKWGQLIEKVFSANVCLALLLLF